MNTLEIKWVDRAAIDGGGTKLTVKVDGAPKHDEGYPPERLEEARKVAAEFVAKATFANVPPAPPSKT
jgi:hypothetical protein